MPTGAARPRLHFLQGFPWAIFGEGHEVRHQLDGHPWTAQRELGAGCGPAVQWTATQGPSKHGDPAGGGAATAARAKQGAAMCLPRGGAGFSSVRKGFRAGGRVARRVGRALLGLALFSDPSHPPAP